MSATSSSFQETSSNKLKQPINNSGVFKVVNEFFGYRAKEELTDLPPGYLVQGSQNVITLATGQVAVRGGYTLDGQETTGIVGIGDVFDWQNHLGFNRHLRIDKSGGKLQLRYVGTADGQSWSGNTIDEDDVYWIDVVTGYTDAQTEEVNFAVYWDTTELAQKLLFVNGDKSIYEWSGGVATFASAAATTITLQGSSTWAQLGFLTAGTRAVTINGTSYTYTGGEGTTTLTGVSPDPTLGAYSAGTVIFQTVRTTANTSLSSGPGTNFTNDCIAIVKNQVYLGSHIDNTVYVSKTNSFTDYAFATPRVVGEGAKLTLDSISTAFIPQEDSIYISSGKNKWYFVVFQLDSTNAKESLTVKPLKNSPLQGALSQAGVCNVKNSVLVLTNEPAIDDLGRIADNFALPEAVNMTDSIKNDFLNYDFTNASMIYFKYFLFVAIPAESIVLLYNFANRWWEAPQTMPFTRFSIIEGELYGHSNLAPNTFKLHILDQNSQNSVYNDDDNPIQAIAAFSYMNYGETAWQKVFTEFYTEGNIQINSTIDVAAKYDFGGYSGIKEFQIDGSDSNFIFATTTDGSIGKNPIGSNPLGSITDSPTNTPKFRKIFTTATLNFYEWQPVFESNEVDYYWEISRFGINVKLSQDNNNKIKV